MEKASFTTQPAEILLLIAEKLSPRELYVLTQTCSSLYSFLVPLLHLRALTRSLEGGKTVLEWTAESADRMPLARKLLDLAISSNIGLGVPDYRELLVVAAASDNTEMTVLLFDHIKAHEPRISFKSKILFPPFYGPLKSPLHVATNAGHFGIVRILLERAQIDVESHAGYVLNKAANFGNLDMIRYIRGRGVDLAELYQDADSLTALHTAAMSGQVEVAAYLIREGGMKVDCDDGTGCSPLARAVLNHYPTDKDGIERVRDVVKLLLEEGADASWTLPGQIEQRNGSQLIHQLSTKADCTFLDLVLGAKGVDPSVRNEQGITALHYAASNNRSEAIRQLLRAGADPDLLDDVSLGGSQGRTPFLLAAANRATSACRAFIDGGISISQANADGQTALHLAAHNGPFALVEYLLDAGADPAARDKGGAMPSEYAVTGNYPTSGTVVRLLFDRYKADVNLPINEGGRTLLHEACRWKYRGRARPKELVEVLLEAGADVMAKDKEGMTPLHWAVWSGGRHTKEVCRILLDGGAMDALWLPVHIKGWTYYADGLPLFCARWLEPDAFQFILSEYIKGTKPSASPPVSVLPFARSGLASRVSPQLCETIRRNIAILNGHASQ